MTNHVHMPSNDAMKNKPDGLTEHITNKDPITPRIFLRSVSTVSRSFLGAETDSSACVSGKRLAVSAFPAFPDFGGGCIDG